MTMPPPHEPLPSRAGPLARFFGGPPAWVLMRLVLLSIVLGVIFAVFGLDPRDIVAAFRDLLDHIIRNSAEFLGDLLRYFLLGAVVVFPVWLLLRLLKIGSRG